MRGRPREPKTRRTLLDVCLNRTQVLRQNEQHTQREVRGVSYQETEPLVAEWNECRICRGYRSCAPGALIDQRHLAEDAALA